jgi:hypothetical protein
MPTPDPTAEPTGLVVEEDIVVRRLMHSGAPFWGGELMMRPAICPLKPHFWIGRSFGWPPLPDSGNRQRMSHLVSQRSIERPTKKI